MLSYRGNQADPTTYATEISDEGDVPSIRVVNSSPSSIGPLQVRKNTGYTSTKMLPGPGPAIFARAIRDALRYRELFLMESEKQVEATVQKYLRTAKSF